jgi:hypothetical protein
VFAAVGTTLAAGAGYVRGAVNVGLEPTRGFSLSNAHTDVYV